MPGSKPSIEIAEPSRFATIVADEIHACIDEALEERGRCSIVLSGGRTPSAIYRILSRQPKVGEIDWSKLYLFWGDERWVPPEHNQSNFRMVNETLLSHISGDRPHYYPVDTTLGNVEEGARRYAEVISEVESFSEGGHPVFDLVLLGMGADGHIASIFPGSDVINNSTDICCAAVNPADGGKRVTLSPKVLFGARHILFIVRGEHKAETVRRVFEGEENEQELPAKLFRSASGSVTWLLDTTSSMKLKRPIE